MSDPHPTDNHRRIGLPQRDLPRREWLRASSALGFLSLLGCGGGSSSGTGAGGTASAGSTASKGGTVSTGGTVGSNLPPVASGAPVSNATGSSAFPPTLVLAAAANQQSVPWTFGHAFAQADVPPGSYVTTDATQYQVAAQTYWPDGSLKHAILSGLSDFAAGNPLTVHFGKTATPPASGALAESDLRAALTAAGDASITVGSATVKLSSLIGSAQRQVVSGPVMSNWIYSQTLPAYATSGGLSTLSVWFDVRLYSGGIIEIFPWVENGTLQSYPTAASVQAFALTCSFQIGAKTLFSQSLSLKPQTRVVLFMGNADVASYWANGANGKNGANETNGANGTIALGWMPNPGVTPAHDTKYLMATGLVPNYPLGVSSGCYTYLGHGVGSRYGAEKPFAETYSPNWCGDVPGAMSNVGFHSSIGLLPDWQAIYLAGGADSRAYRWVLSNGLGAGSWPVHYRDATTNDVPNYLSYPSISGSWGGSPPTTCGATYPKPGSAISSSYLNVSAFDNHASMPDTAHQPSIAYLPWLLTGRWFFLDELLMWDFWNYCFYDFTASSGFWWDRKGANASYVMSGQIRGVAWSLRTMAQALCAVPTTHPSYASLSAAWAYNMQDFHETFVSGAGWRGSAFVNNLGCIGIYCANQAATSNSAYDPNNVTGLWWDAPWMQEMWMCMIGYAWDLGLPEPGTTASYHQSIRDFAYSQIVGRCGDPANPNTWDYRYFSSYGVPYGTISGAVGVAPTWYANWGQAYTAFLAFVGSNFSVARSPVLPIPAPPSGSTDLWEVNMTLYPNSRNLFGFDGSYWSTLSECCMGFAALSYAVKHGASGASAAWSRLTSSPSFGAANSGSNGWQYIPIWAIYP